MEQSTASDLNGQSRPRDEGQRLRDSLRDNGYVIIPSALTAEQLDQLREAARSTTRLAHAGKWPHLRTLPKQFPPWKTTPEDGIWGIQHLLHPDLPFSPAFAQSYFAPFIMEPAKQLLECTDNELVMELYNMLIRPDRDFELKWHRDDISADATAEQEMERLNKPAFHAQWNLALFEDRSLVAVPGSHKRPRTDEERHASPFEQHITGQEVIQLKAGDLAFYNNNILHRGVYDSSVERMTLHGSVGDARGSQARARNVLQHAVGEWVAKCDFSSLDLKTKVLAEHMRERLVDLGRENENVGFAHKE